MILAIITTRSVTRPVHGSNDRLTSLNANCLEDLSAGLEACADGDLTRVVTPTTPVELVESTTARPAFSETFNEMLGRTQRSVSSYNTMRERLGDTIGQVSSSAGAVSSASRRMADL